MNIRHHDNAASNGDGELESLLRMNAVHNVRMANAAINNYYAWMDYNISVVRLIDECAALLVTWVALVVPVLGFVHTIDNQPVLLHDRVHKATAHGHERGKSSRKC